MDAGIFSLLLLFDCVVINVHFTHYHLAMLVMDKMEMHMYNKWAPKNLQLIAQYKQNTIQHKKM